MIEKHEPCDFEVLLSCMYQKDFQIAYKTKIDSDLLIINQCDKEDYQEQIVNGYLWRMISTTERGSSQSRNKALDNARGRMLKNNQNVLFVGCPCDVYALKRYLGKDYDGLLSCELVCMGVSSYRIAEAYKKYVERKYHDRLVKVNARSKLKGWFVPHLEERYEASGRTRCNTLYGTYLGYGMQVYNRPSCFYCKFRGMHGVGDMVSILNVKHLSCKVHFQIHAGEPLNVEGAIVLYTTGNAAKYANRRI